MKKTAICFLLSLIVLLFATSYEASAQSTSPSASSAPSTEQSLQELVKEVRQLKSEVRRLSIANYKGQVLVEQLKFQQAEIIRLSGELSDVRENLDDARTKQAKVMVMIKGMEKDIDSGFKSDKDMNPLKVELETSAQSEQRLIEREVQITNELREGRAKLAKLEVQLKAIENEMAGK